MSNAKSTPPKVLHVHSTFAAGGKELRAVQLMNAFGKKLHHTIVSAMPEQMAAREHIGKHLKVAFPKKFPSLTGFPSPGRLIEIAKAMKPYDLILTYNWGAMDATMAHGVFAQRLGLPPLIHHEDGFNEDEAGALKKRRNYYRRAALTKSTALIVPSERLETIALNRWGQPRANVHRIPNGINTKAFAGKPRPNALRVIKREGERWVGTLAGLRPVKQLDQLVRAFAPLPEHWQLVILGDGPEREAIKVVADSLEISHRVHLPGAVPEPSKVIGMFDIFALSSASEQFPLSVVEAMAAGLPVAAPEVGDITSMVAQSNRNFIVKSSYLKGLERALSDLSQDEELRKSIGLDNRERAREHFDEADMIDRYRKLYSRAIGCEF